MSQYNQYNMGYELHQVTMAAFRALDQGRYELAEKLDKERRKIIFLQKPEHLEELLEEAKRI